MRHRRHALIRIAFLLLGLAGQMPFEGAARAQGANPASGEKDQDSEIRQLNEQAVQAWTRGDFATGAQIADRALNLAVSRHGQDHPISLASLNVVALLYSNQGRFDEAEPLFVRGLRASERVLGPDHEDTLTLVNNLGELYRGMGRFAEAEPLLLRSLETNERIFGRDHRKVAGPANNLALLYALQGRSAESEPLFVRARRISERALGADHQSTLRIQNNLAEFYRTQSRFAEAEPLLLRGLEASERTQGRDHPDTLTSVNNLAMFYDNQERFDDAEPLYRRSAEAFERTLGRDHPDALTAVGNLAGFLIGRGRDPEAEPLLLRAFETSARLFGADYPFTIQAATALAGVRVRKAGGSDSALDPARLAAAGVRARRSLAMSDSFAAAQSGRERSSFASTFAVLAAADWGVSEGSTDPTQHALLVAEAFDALQDATAGTTDRAVVQMAVRHLADQAGEGLGALVRERDALDGQWVANRDRYSQALSAADSSPDSENLKGQLREERSRIEARMTEIDARLRRDFPQYFDLVRPQALDLAAVQPLIGPDEAILMVVPTDFGTFIVALSTQGLLWGRSGWTATQVNGAVQQLLGDIRTTMAGGHYSFNRQTAYNMYRQFVAPFASRLAGKRHVFVITAGALTSLPFGILVTEQPRGRDDDPRALRRTRWFADANALIQIPSIQSLQFLRRYNQRSGPADSSPGSFIGFGNPTLAGPADPEACSRGRGWNGATAASVASPVRTRSGGMRANVGLIRQLCPLPGTAVELESMRAAFHADTTSLFLADRANERDFRALDLSRTRILALATHGLVAGDIPGSTEPGLVFTPPATATDEDDGFLTASEVSALRLDADWVILSACNTASGDGSAGAPGLSGLARAFFYAGARNLLASHWPVADDASARLTVRTIELMRGNPALSRAEALQRSMREIRDNRTHAVWAHPGVWAPFTLIGDGAR